MIAYPAKIAKLDDMNNYIIVLFGLFFLIQCSSTEKKSETPTLVEDKYRLKEDRDAIETLRADIPEEKRQQNDEIALNLKWMNEKKMTPSAIRSSFSQIVAKKRKIFNQDINKSRQEFSTTEKAKRKEFDDKMRLERESIRAYKKSNSKEKKQMMENLEIKRKEFNLSQKSLRDTYEEEVKDKKKSFEDYMKQRNDEFNADLKIYTIEYNEKKKEDKEKLKSKTEKAREDAVELKRIRLETEGQ